LGVLRYLLLVLTARRPYSGLPSRARIGRYRVNFYAITLVDRIVENSISPICRARRKAFIVIGAAIDSCIDLTIRLA
jgi:hypothetical protein